MPPREKPPCTETMRQLGLNPDLWQIEVFEGGHERLILNCCRQAGKSTTVALLALAEALWVGGTQVLLLSRSLRQSQELFKILLKYYKRLGSPARERQTAGELYLKTFSRIVCLPCKEDTIRGYSNINLLIIDEAARVPDDLYRAVSPMLAVSNGRMICLSTPYGKRGFFYDAWANGGADWHRIQVAATGVPRKRTPRLGRILVPAGILLFLRSARRSRLPRFRPRAQPRTPSRRDQSRRHGLRRPQSFRRPLGRPRSRQHPLDHRRTLQPGKVSRLPP